MVQYVCAELYLLQLLLDCNTGGRVRKESQSPPAGCSVPQGCQHAAPVKESGILDFSRVALLMLATILLAMSVLTLAVVYFK